MEAAIRELMGAGTPPSFKFKDTHASIEFPSGYTIPSQATLEAKYDELLALEEDIQKTVMEGDLEVGTSNLFVDTQTGNIGIGTNSPIGALDINAGPENDTTPALAIRGGIYDESDLYVLNSYNVNTGVGYAAKVIGVNIKNKVETNNTVKIRDNQGGLTSAGAIYLGSDDENQGIFGVLGATGAAGTTLSEHLTVRAGGNVGIGTASPMNTGLHIANSYFASGGNTTHLNPQIFITGDSGTSGNQVSAIGFSGNSSGDTHQRMVAGSVYYKGGGGNYGMDGYLGIAVANSSTSGTDPYGLTEGELESHTRIAIKNNGNVGIGTTSPGIVLDVGSSLSNPQIGRNYATGSVHDADKRDAIYFGRWDGTGRDFLGIKCRVDTHTALGYGDYSNQTKLEFYTWGNNYASSREVMCIRGDGNVGIGTNNPTRKFQLGIGSGQLGGYLDTYLNSGVVAGMVLGVKQGGGPEMDAMYISDSGYVGIGTNRPLTSFHIKRTGDHSDMMYLEGKTTSGDNAISGGINFKHASAHASGYRGVTWFSTNGNFTMGGVTMAVGGSYNLCRIAFHAAKNRADGSTVRAYIDGNGTGGDLNFTGQHRCFIKEIPFTNIENFEGLIVSANQNEYVKMTDGVKTGSNAITMNESLPVVSLSTKVNDKKCFGVISASEDTETRENRYGNLVSVFEKELGDTRVYINSLGEGAMWVVNTAGTLESGDYITTSNVAGYGQRQDSDSLKNYTVAKITMDCDFAPATQPIQIIKKELQDVNYWVNATYENVSLEEYSNLAEDVRTTTTEIYYSNEDGEITTDKYNTLESNVQSTYTELTRTIHQKISTEESKTEQEGSTLEVRQELINVLDEHGQLQWEDHPTDTEKAYKIRYLTSDGTQTDEANAVHIAAFVGCTYHCG